MRRALQDEAPFLLAGLVLWGFYLNLILPYLPNAAGNWAPDYYLHFPNLLVGLAWERANGPFVAPWFNPSQCGGVPYFADPNVAYYSLPQALAFFMPIASAIRASVAIFAALGFIGAYVFMRASFAASRAAALLTAALFLFNGFYAARMMAGHLTFHAFMLAPWVGALLLPTPRTLPASWTSLVARCLGTALLFAYSFQSGMVHGIPPVVLSMLMLLLLHGLPFGFSWRPFLILSLGGLGALALSASKLSAELAWLSQFPRDLYPLPGIAYLPVALLIGPLTLLGYAPEKPHWLVNTVWLIDRHEWEYGVSVAPFLLFASALARWTIASRIKAFAGPTLAALAVLAFLIAVPTALNLYTPGWNAFLKSLPYFGNSNTLLRFLSAYILPITVGAGLALDFVAPPDAPNWRGGTALAALAIAIMALQNVATPRAYYADTAYDPSAIEAAAADVRAGGSLPPVTRIADDAAGPAAGVSILSCYQPLFGYKREVFPREELHVGPIETALGPLNFKNPTCYVFPSENACDPGDPFDADDRERARAFAAYRPFPFVRSTIQNWADAINAAAIGLFAVGLVGIAAIGAIRAFKARAT